MKTFLLLLFMMKSIDVSAQELFQVDFSNPQEQRYWNKVNDSVMGGLSESNLRVQDNIAYFAGDLSLKNNGGFASVRRFGPLEFQSNQSPIRLQVKGDGRTYQFRLRTNRGFDGMAYVASFSTQADEWQTFDFSEDDFIAQFRGRRIIDAPTLAFSQVRQLGFMLADKQPGKFALAVKSISQ
jgi:monofunctional biosynthetic peptidoglycan transglycosylase